MSMVRVLMHKIANGRGECNFAVNIGHLPVFRPIERQYGLLATSTGTQVIGCPEFFTDINNPVLHVLPFWEKLTEHGG
jgi:hypothetical protein